MTDTTDRLRAAAQRALESLDDLIANTTDPGVEALGARYELARELSNTSPVVARQVLGTTTGQPEGEGAVDRATPAELIRDSVTERLKDCVWITVDDAPMALAESWPDAQSLIDAIHTAAGLDSTENTQPTVDRATVLREAADEADRAGGLYAGRGDHDRAGASFALMEKLRRKADEAEYTATPCSWGACEPGGEPCTTHERLMAHAEGDHELCDHPADEAQQPTPAPTAPTVSTSYALEHREPGTATWRRGLPGPGPVWTWEGRTKADQRLADARERYPHLEVRMVTVTTTVHEQPTPAPAEERPVVAYNDGMGNARIYCVRCPRPDDVVYPLDINAVEDWDICPSCGRHCIDVARATPAPAEETTP